MINPIQLKSTNTASILENDLSNSLKSRNDTNLEQVVQEALNTPDTILALSPVYHT